MVLDHRMVDGTKKPLGVDVGIVLLPAVAMVHRRAISADPAIGGDGLVRFGQLRTQRLGDRPRDFRSRIDLVERVAVPLEKLDLLEAQAKDLIATDRLQKASQGLGVKLSATTANSTTGR